MTQLVIDEAWTKADPAAIKASGYVGVIGYLSNDPSKNMTVDRVKALHKAGLSVRLVWETTSTRASQGRIAGWTDRRAAEKQAAALGYPKWCPIFYAVDYDAPPVEVIPYFKGVQGGSYPVGAYGSERVIGELWAQHLALHLWQTQAWSGSSVSPVAHLYQRTAKTRPLIAGVPSNSYDEDAVLRYTPAWPPATAGALPWWYKRPLRKGMSGPDVRAMKRRLIHLGYKGMVVNRWFRGGTDRAVRAFQAAHKLHVDGVVGVTTAAAIRAAGN